MSKRLVAISIGSLLLFVCCWLLLSRPAPGRIAGTVTDRERLPLPAAVVCASCANCEPLGAAPSACTTSNSQGHFTIASPPAGEYYLSAAAPGWTSFDDSVEVSPWPTNKARPAVELQLLPAHARLSGTVVDASGRLVPRASVRIVRLKPRLSLDITSDDNGRFSLSLPEGYVDLAAEAPGYAPARAGWVVPSESAKLVLIPASRVRGVVVGNDGRPRNGVEVRALPLGRFPLARPSLTNARGEFVLDGLEPGDYSIAASGRGLYGALPGHVHVRIAERIEVVLLVAAPANEVSGRVSVAGSDAPCRTGYVNLGQPDVSSTDDLNPAHLDATLGPELQALIEPDGRVRFPGVPAGRYFATVHCIGHVLRDGPRVLEFGLEGEHDFSWRVEPGVALRVDVVDASSRPVAGAHIALRATHARGRVELTPWTADRRGRCEIPGLAPGRYELVASEGAERAEPVVIDLKQGSDRITTTLRLRGSGSAEITVVNEQSAPVEDVRVSLVAAQSGTATEAKASGRGWAADAIGGGRFRIDGVPAGRYLVIAEDEQNPPERLGEAPGSELWVRDGELAQARLVLARDGVIAGRVLDPLGQPAANVWITAKYQRAGGDPETRPAVVYAFGAGPRVLTSSEGRFEITGLAPYAQYTLRFERPAGTATVQRDVEPGHRLDFRLPAPAAVSGWAVDARGQPLSQFLVRAINSAAETAQEWAVHDASGRFSIEDVSPGEVELQLITPGGELTTSTLELAPAEHKHGIRMRVEAPAALPAGG